MCIRLVTLQKQWAIIRLYIIKAAFIAAPSRHMRYAQSHTWLVPLCTILSWHLYCYIFCLHWLIPLWINIDQRLTSLKIKINVQKRNGIFHHCAGCLPCHVRVSIFFLSWINKELLYWHTPFKAPDSVFFFSLHFFRSVFFFVCCGTPQTKHVNEYMIYYNETAVEMFDFAENVTISGNEFDMNEIGWIFVTFSLTLLCCY